MAKIKHYINGDTGETIRETKVGNRVEYKSVSKDDLEMYEAGRSIFGCIGFIVVFVFILFGLLL